MLLQRNTRHQIALYYYGCFQSKNYFSEKARILCPDCLNFETPHLMLVFSAPSDRSLSTLKKVGALNVIRCLSFTDHRQNSRIRKTKPTQLFSKAFATICLRFSFFNEFFSSGPPSRMEKISRKYIQLIRIFLSKRKSATK